MQHKPECGAIKGTHILTNGGGSRWQPRPCDCGLDQALEALSLLPPALSVERQIERLAYVYVDHYEGVHKTKLEAYEAGLRDGASLSQGEAVQKDRNELGAPASQSLAVPLSAVSAPSSQDAAAIGGATLSRDYEVLREHLNHRDHFALAIIGEHVAKMKMMPNCTTLVSGTMGSHVLSAHKTAFIAECTRLSLEWVAPANASAAWIPVDAIMEVFDEAVEATIEHGDEDEAQDWLDIKDVRKELHSRLTVLLPSPPTAQP